MANVKQPPRCQVEMQAAWLKLLVLKVTLFLVLLETVWSFAINTNISTIYDNESILETFSPSLFLSSRTTVNTILMTNVTSLKPSITGMITETQPLDSQTSVFTSKSFSSLKGTVSIQETSTKSLTSSMLDLTSKVMSSSTSKMMEKPRISVSSAFVNSTRKPMLSDSSQMQPSQSRRTFIHFKTSSQSSKQIVLNTSVITISPSSDLRRTYYSDMSSQLSSLQGLASLESMTPSSESPFSMPPQKSSAGTTQHRSVEMNVTQSSVYLTSSSVPVCPGSPNCNDNTKQPKNKDFLYIILGVGIGAAVLFFVIFMAVAICMKRRQQRKPSTHYKRGGKHQSERAADELLETKESVFNSSTLQLGKGIYNDGLEMDDSLMCILPSSPKTGETIEDNLQSQSTFRPQQDVQPEPLTVHVSMEQVDRIPSGIQPSAMFGLSQELKHDASIRLLQDWHEELSDSSSEEYKELKSDVESSIRDVYRSKEGFRDVTVEGFRKGSVIANISLILLAVVKNPLELLEKSVSQGKVGNLSVDKHFSVTRRKDNDNASDDEFFDRRQPYMQRILSKGGMRKPAASADQDTTNASESDASGIESPPSAGSPSSDSFLLDKRQHGGQVTRKSTSDQKDNESESTTSNFRPTSLIDLRRVEPIKFRDQRDSGIGSMQELSKFESNRISRQDSILENAEQVFYDIPEAQDVADPQNITADKKVSNTELKSPADQGIAHVALFDFVGKDSRELSVRQGELVYVTQKESIGWVKVVNAENYRGWVPSSFLVLVSQSQLASTQQTVETLEFFDNVLDQLEEESGSELSAASTPEAEVYLEPVRTDAEIDTTNDNDSHDYLTIIPDKSIEMQASQCKTVYAFTANDPSEMSFEQGVIISILKTTNTGWWKGKITDQEGWFPSSYVMPLKEPSTDVLPDLNTESTAIIPDSAEDHESSSQIPDKQPYTEPVIYDEPEISSENNEHKYQSLKKQFKPPENYANLYLQILKRESKVEEDIEKYAAAIQVRLKEADPERPLRSAPVPPREEARDKPAVPPRAKTQLKEEEKRKKVIELSSKPKAVSSHGEPPKRPVPPPPTAKPALIPITAKPALIPDSQGKKKDDIIFLDKEITSKTKPASKIDYENVPKKPSRSTEFIKKENIKHPVEVVSLVNEFKADESSAGSNVVLVKNGENDTSPAIVKNPTAVTSAKEDIQSSSEDTSMSNDVVDAGLPSSEGKLSSSVVTHAKKPLKPLPKLDSFDKSVLDAPIPMSRPNNVNKAHLSSNKPVSTEPKPTERPRKQLPDLAATRLLSKENSTPPSPVSSCKGSKEESPNSPKKQASIPSEKPSKPLPSLDSSNQSSKEGPSSSIHTSLSKNKGNEISRSSNKEALSDMKSSKMQTRPSIPQKPSLDLSINEASDTDYALQRSSSSPQRTSDKSFSNDVISPANRPVKPTVPNVIDSPRLHKPAVPSKELPNLKENDKPSTEMTAGVLNVKQGVDSEDIKLCSVSSNVNQSSSESPNRSKAAKPGFAIRKEDILNKKSAIDNRGISAPDSKTGHDIESRIKFDNSKDDRTPPRPHQGPDVKKPVRDSQLDSDVLKSNQTGHSADSKRLESQKKGPFDNVKTSGKLSVNSGKPVLVENTTTPTSASTSADSLDSTDAAKSVTNDTSIRNIQPGSPKPQPPTKPLVSAVKPSVLAAKPSLLATKSASSSPKPLVSVQPSSPATKPVVPAAKPSASATQTSVSAVKPIVFASKPLISGAKPSVVAAKPSNSVAKESTSDQNDSPAKKHRDDAIASPKLSEKPRHPVKPVTPGSPKRITKNDVTERMVKPVPAKRITKETVAASIQSKPNEPLSNEDSRSSPVPKDSNTGSSASPKSSAESCPRSETAISPVPVPRPKARPSKESQDAQPKTKPERPSSPPTTTVPVKDKPKPDRPPQPDRPPPPSVQSPSKTPTSAVKSKDRSKLRKVVKSYAKTSNKELDLVVGEFLFELACEGDNSYGLLDNGSEGWYPTNHVVAVDSAS